jgi:hypothetical protein
MFTPIRQAGAVVMSGIGTRTISFSGPAKGNMLISL